MANTKVQSEQIQDGSITADKIADGAIVATELADNAVTTAKINADAVTGAKIADDAIDSEHYTDGSIDTAHIADSQITVAKMAANSVDSDQYVDGSIDTVHLGDLQVTTAKIANGNISTAKIADNAVTSAKLDTNIDIAGTLDVTGATTLDAGLNATGVFKLIGSRSTFVDASEDSAARSHMFVTNDGVGDFSQEAGHLVIQARTHTSVYRDIIFAGGINNASDLMRITGEGNVGINTASPSTKLEVNGGIRLSGLNGGDGLKFDMAGSTDYVIKESSTNDVFSFGGLIHHNISSSNVGIGTTSPTGTIHISKTTTSTDGSVYPSLKVENLSAGSGNSYANIVLNGGNGTTQFSILNDGRSSDSIVRLRTDTASPIAFLTNGSERMRITSDGLVAINATTTDSFPLRVDGGAGNRGINITNISYNADRGAIRTSPSGNTTYQAAVFLNHNSTNVGRIEVTSANTSYNTSSDYRLKENVTTLQNGLQRLNQLKPVKFNWKENGQEDEGFIAHEVEDVFPYAVTGEKDAVNEDGEIQGQQMDYGRITPLLVKAIQEQQTIIEDLKARIEALES